MTDMQQTPATSTQAAAASGAAASATASGDGSWIDRYAPDAIRPYLHLSRADRPAGYWTLIIPALWGLLAAAAATGWRPFDWWILVACVIGAVLMRGAGCSWNDIADRDIDARVERTRSRPLPSGRLSVRQALIWMCAQAFVAFLILLSFNMTAVKLGIAAVLLILIYPFGKRFTWWPQFILGLNLNWGVWIAWAAHSGEISLAPAFLFAGGVAWTMFYDTIYAHQDIEDDTLIGVKSTARLFGRETKPWLHLFTMSAVLMWTAGVILALAPTGRPLALGIGVAAVWTMGWHMSRLSSQVDLDDPDSCLAAFRALPRTGMILVVALLLVLLL